MLNFFKPGNCEANKCPTKVGDHGATGIPVELTTVAATKWKILWRYTTSFLTRHVPVWTQPGVRQMSLRSTAPFVLRNCPSVPERAAGKEGRDSGRGGVSEEDSLIA